MIRKIQQKWNHYFNNNSHTTDTDTQSTTKLIMQEQQFDLRALVQYYRTPTGLDYRSVTVQHILS